DPCPAHAGILRRPPPGGVRHFPYRRPPNRYEPRHWRRFRAPRFRGTKYRGRIPSEGGRNDPFGDCRRKVLSFLPRLTHTRLRVPPLRASEKSAGAARWLSETRTAGSASAAVVQSRSPTWAAPAGP